MLDPHNRAAPPVPHDVERGSRTPCPPLWRAVEPDEHNGGAAAAVTHVPQETGLFADQEAVSPVPIGDLRTQQVYHGNFLEMASALPDQSVDLIIADPPYNASKGNDWSMKHGTLPGFGGDWKKIAQVWDDMSLDEYMRFTLSWLSEAKRILKQTGSLWAHGTYHNAGITNVAIQILGMEIINEIVWYKRNSFPNLAGRRLTASHETVLWAHRGGKRSYCFNYEYSKSGDFSDDALKMPGKQMRTVWDLSNNKPKQELAYGKHPAQKPVRLARRFIRLSAQPGHVCLVPFAGAGSECVAARAEGLHYIGFETEASYVETARARLSGGAG